MKFLVDALKCLTNVKADRLFGVLEGHVKVELKLILQLAELRINLVAGRLHIVVVPHEEMGDEV